MKNLKLKTLLALILSVGLVGCAVNKGDWETAEKVCKEQGGIDRIYAFPTKEIYCNSGTITQISWDN